MRVSIVIPTFNSKKTIGKCLEHIRGMEYRSDLIEIIIVDNGSTDRTCHIVKEYGIYPIIDDTASISRLRNIGAIQATGDVLGFIDSDCLVPKGWLRDAIKILNNDRSIGILGGHYLPTLDGTWVERTWCKLKSGIDGEVNFISAGDMLIWKTLFNRIGGFDETLVTGEDYEICQRIKMNGKKIWSSSNLDVVHLGNVKTLREVLKKERWYGFGMFSSLKYNLASKPFMLALLYLILFPSFFILVIFNRFLAFFTLVAIVLMPVISSFYVTRHVKQGRVKLAIMCTPILFCYALGRALSILDFIISKKLMRKK